MQKKNSIYLEGGKFILNNKPHFVYSGEIHYFRTPYNRWRKYLKKAGGSGFKYHIHLYPMELA